MKDEKVGPIRQGVMWLRKLILPSSGLTIGEVNLYSKRDASGNTDLYLARQDGTDVNLTGELLFCRATGSNLLLTTTAQSMTGDGDSSKVRLLLPAIGTWLVSTDIDFNGSVAGFGLATGELFVNDSGSAETGVVRFGNADDQGTVGQQWSVTTTAANMPVELKVRKTIDAGTAYANATHTTLMATMGAGGGSTVEAVDHGTLTGRGDDDHIQYGQLADAETVPGIWDFTNGLKADTISESTAATGVTADGVLLKDGEVDGVDVAARDHNAITLTAAAQELLNLSTQELGFEVQAAHQVLIGPYAGDPADPTFRALAADDIPNHHAQNSDTGTTVVSFVVYQNAESAKIALAGQATGGNFTTYLRPNAALSANRIITFPDVAGEVVIHVGSVISIDTIDEDTPNAGVTVDGVLLKDSEVTTDVIHEKTPGAGITVDGLLIKDNFMEVEEIPTPANPALNNMRIFARASGDNIVLIARSSQGAEAVLATLDDTAGAHTNTLGLNWIE